MDCIQMGRQCGLASRSTSDFSKRQPATTNQNHNSSNNCMELSRTISRSFAESNNDQLPSPPSFDDDMLDQRDDQCDDISLGDASWKDGLNQVASIEEDKFEARQGAITPVDRICLNLSSDVSNSTMETKNTPINREKRDAPPTKRIRSTSTDEKRELHSAFSNESMRSFGSDSSKIPVFNNVGESKHSLKPSRTKEEPADRDSGYRDLVGGNLSWESKEQDSFGGGFAISSNLTDGISGEVLGNSFSFVEDFPHASQGNRENNAISALNPSESIELTCGPEPSPKETFSPKSATYVSNTASQGRCFSMDSPRIHNSGPAPGPRYAAHPASNRFGMLPPYPDNRNGHCYRPPTPYGMGRPPRYLHASFQPPPAGMAGPPMTRDAPQPVYIMSSPHGLQDGLNKLGGSFKMSNEENFSWSKNDDTSLKEVLKKHKNPKDWDAISKDFGGGRTAKECNERWIRCLMPGVRKGQWQDHEDAIVIEAVNTCKKKPFTRWTDLAQKLPGRMGKQIRDRWVNHLDPNINHSHFSKEEDMKLWGGHLQFGKRWVVISTKLFNSSRSENKIKNRWYSASFRKFVASKFGPDAYFANACKVLEEENEVSRTRDSSRNECLSISKSLVLGVKMDDCIQETNSKDFETYRLLADCYYDSDSESDAEPSRTCKPSKPSSKQGDSMDVDEPTSITNDSVQSVAKPACSVNKKKGKKGTKK